MHEIHKLFQDENMKQYFNTLPLTVQEAVFQSGVNIRTMEELKNFADNYTGKH